MILNSASAETLELLNLYTYERTDGSLLNFVAKDKKIRPGIDHSFLKRNRSILQHFIFTLFSTGKTAFTRGYGFISQRFNPQSPWRKPLLH